MYPIACATSLIVGEGDTSNAEIKVVILLTFSGVSVIFIVSEFKGIWQYISFLAYPRDLLK